MTSAAGILALYIFIGILPVLFGWKGLNWYGRILFPVMWLPWLIIDGGRERP